MKKICFFLCTLMYSSLHAYDFEKKGIYYNIKGEEAVVTYRDTKVFTLENANETFRLTIPKSIKYNKTEYLVTEIGNNAFAAELRLTSVTIPNTIVFIDRYAFRNCSALSSIKIPNSVRNIGQGAFERCNGLRSIIMPENVTEIACELFSGCDHLKAVTIPKGTVRIGENAFSGCVALKRYIAMLWNRQC